jgi:hypothetical protein
MKQRDYLLTVSAYLTSKSNQRGERREREGWKDREVKGERGGGRERWKEREVKGEREVAREKEVEGEIK